MHIQKQKLAYRCGVSVVVPVYNAAPTLVTLVSRIQKTLQPSSFDFEIILVNDNSRDASWSTIEQLCADHPKVFGVNLLFNVGQHNALLAGLRLAQFDITATLDDDLQHPPESIPDLIAALSPEVDVVYGTPDALHHGFVRNLASRIIKYSLRIAMGVRLAQHVSAFRVFRSELGHAFHSYNSPFVSIDVLLSWATKKFTNTTVPHMPRATGESNYSFFMLLKHAITMVTGFSTAPLRLASFLGFAATGFGVLILFYVIIRFIIEGGSVPGFPFLASVIAIFAGTQLFTLGILGEYLARLFINSMGKPSFVIKEIRQGNTSTDGLSKNTIS